MVMSDPEHKNFIEAKMIIQEFHDDPTVYVVGTAPFGKIWFDHDKLEQQYKVLTDSWHEEYGDNETLHSKKPRVVNILIAENDTMFNKYRESIRDAQRKKQEDEGGSLVASNQVPADSDTENTIISKAETPVPKKKQTRPKKRSGVGKGDKVTTNATTNATSSAETLGDEAASSAPETKTKKSRGKKKLVVQDPDNGDSKA